MTTAPGVRCVFRDGAFWPLESGGWAARARRFYGEGVEYLMEESPTPSTKTRSHFHATLAEVFKNLPAELAEQYPSIEHLRKRALIETGFCTHTVAVLDNVGQAVRVAGFLKNGTGAFNLVVRRDATVTLYVPLSERDIAKDKARYQDMKDKVLGWAAGLIGVKVDDLKKNTGAAA